MKIGDRVRLDNGGCRDNYTGVGIITGFTKSWKRARINFEECSNPCAPTLSYPLDRLTLEPEENPVTDHSRYTEDPEIQRLLAQIDDAVRIWQSGRMKNDYSIMCLALDMMRAASETIYNRNHEIEVGTALDEAVIPAIPEEVSAAFPGADESELAYEGEHQPRIADVLSPTPPPDTLPAMPARIETLSGRVYEITRLDCPDPSSTPSSEPEASCPPTTPDEEELSPGERILRLLRVNQTG